MCIRDRVSSLLGEEKGADMSSYKNLEKLTSTLKSPYCKSRPKSTIPRKLCPLNCEFLQLQTDAVYRCTSEMLNKEIYLYNRWQAIKAKRQVTRDRAMEVSKNKTVKTEMMSELMGSKLAAYDCLHLANQYSRLVGLMCGKLSEAAIEESKTVVSEESQAQSLKECLNEYENVFVLSASKSTMNGDLDVILTEQYSFPYINLSKTFCKRASALAGRKRTFDPESI
eukprot:TRINITY_DN15875_c0_g1_i1.p1 TRINITY_DN15875_c0_g1~~TRINITY_DN15875_c0_g1_i1.p1  ORF type:complete len:225 (-),score=49.61 TRINITY_DN15875_c0_g1_i1:53-727(-)